MPSLLEELVFGSTWFHSLIFLYCALSRLAEYQENTCSTLLYTYLAVYTNAHLFSRRCAQCFRPFPDGVFYEFEGRKYCEHDFHVLFAPCCAKCGKPKIHKLLF